MAELRSLLALKGVMAAFEFRGSGELLDQAVAEGANLDLATLDLIAHMCAANMSMATLQARGWEATTGMQGFYPVREVVLLGFDWSVMVTARSRAANNPGGNAVLPPYVGLILANRDVSYQQALAAFADLAQ